MASCNAVIEPMSPALEDGVLTTGPPGMSWVFNLKILRLHCPVLLPGKSQRQRSLEGYSPWDHEESEMTERLHFHFSLSCIGEGNGNPLQCSCLENPRDRGAWWAAVYGVAQSRTRLKRLSSSSSRLWPMKLRCPWDFPGKNTGVGCHFFLQGIFLSQGSNPHLLHPRWRCCCCCCCCC